LNRVVIRDERIPEANKSATKAECNSNREATEDLDMSKLYLRAHPENRTTHRCSNSTEPSKAEREMSELNHVRDPL
jgi:hypothetical protein